MFLLEEEEELSLSLSWLGRESGRSGWSVKGAGEVVFLAVLLSSTLSLLLHVMYVPAEEERKAGIGGEDAIFKRFNVAFYGMPSFCDGMLSFWDGMAKRSWHLCSISSHT